MIVSEEPCSYILPILGYNYNFIKTKVQPDQERRLNTGRPIWNTIALIPIFIWYRSQLPFIEGVLQRQRMSTEKTRVQSCCTLSRPASGATGLKVLLEELGVAFDYDFVDLLEGKEQDAAMDKVERWNPSGSFPTLVIDNKRAIVGFREQEIREALAA